MHKKDAYVCIRRRGVGECIRDMHKKDAYVCIIDMHKVAQGCIRRLHTYA